MLTLMLTVGINLVMQVSQKERENAAMETIIQTTEKEGNKKKHCFIYMSSENHYMFTICLRSFQHILPI